MDIQANAIELARKLWGKIKSGRYDFESYLNRLTFLMSQIGITWEDLETDEIHAERIIRRNVVTLIKHYAKAGEIKAYAQSAAYNINRLLVQYEISADAEDLKGIKIPDLSEGAELENISQVLEPIDEFQTYQF
jgi:hypothetical protein